VVGVGTGEVLKAAGVKAEYTATRVSSLKSPLEEELATLACLS
jgi:hypothetical protein